MLGLKQLEMVGGERLGIQEFRLWSIGEGGWVSAGLVYKESKWAKRGLSSLLSHMALQGSCIAFMLGASKVPEFLA